MHTKLSSTLPAWRIVRPEPADELLDAYRDAEAEFGIPWKYLAAINLVETGIGRIRGTSIAGAQGPMQFMPAHLGGLRRRRRHQRHPRRDPRRRPLPGRQQRRQRHRPRAVPLQPQQPLRRRRADLRRPDRRAPAGLPRLLPLGHLVPHRPGRGVPPDRLRAVRADPGRRADPGAAEPSRPGGRGGRRRDPQPARRCTASASTPATSPASGELFEHGALAEPTAATSWRAARTAVAAFYAAGTQLHDGSPRTKHLVTNVVLDIDDERGHATARSSYLVLQQVGAGPLQPIITGRYHDTFERARRARGASPSVASSWTSSAT